MKEKDMFKDIEQILMRRAVADAPEYLARQIIAAAAREQQGEVVSFKPALAKTGLWAELKDMLSVPAPAYAFAFMLVLGVGVGFFGDVSYALPGMTTNDLSDIMAINDSFTAGEWL